MTITALIPTKNRSKLLIRSINSVLDQSYQDVIVNVRDNCSTDDTELKIKETYSSNQRVFYKKNIVDIGAYENFRQGLKGIDTEYFSILSDDDYLESSFYANAIKLFQEYPAASFVVFTVDMVDEEGKFLFNNKIKSSVENVKAYTSTEGIDGFLENRFPATWTGYVFKKEVADAIDFPEFSEIGYGLDIFFIWYAASRFNFVVANIKGANFTIHSNSISNTLVMRFDERFIYWWRNRIQIILNDNKICSEVKKKIQNFYFKKAKTRYPDKFFHIISACNLISKRLSNGEKQELRFDLIAIRSFIPPYAHFLIKYFFIPMERAGIIKIIRHIIFKIKKIR